jgi:Predicted dehydrogenases and related proteins
MSRTLKSFFQESTEPFYIHYRVNAGFIPASHWLHDPDQGGGRLVGEGCHFIDYLCFLTGQTPFEVSAIALPDRNKYSRDNFLVTVKFADGSLGSLAYLSNGSKRYGKEYIEVFSAGKIGILNDFRSLQLIDENHTTTERSTLRQDKGHQAAWQAFLSAVRGQAAEPIPYRELLLSSYAALACRQALLEGQPINLESFMQSA